MEFLIERKGNENFNKYPTEDMKLAQKFANSLKKELDDFVLGVVMFGSSVRREATKRSDIDVLVITDDTSITISEPLIEAYRIIVEKLMNKISLKLHITSMTFTSFWEHVKNGDPVVVNILRDGAALMDTGFFTPLQELLKQGRVRPSEEAIWRYYGRAPRTLLNSRWHVLQASLDLYWAVIDAAHGALMRKNQIPPTPEHVADMLDKVYVKPKLLDSKYSNIMRRFYKLSKMITHREIQQISGQEYEKYFHDAEDFVKTMRKLIMVK
tara:strand:- start:4340 stop:5143 length:804 start_codon:yes stop_codon:yes gene_type:complete